MLDFLTALVYWEILISGVILSIVVPPSHRKFLFITELATPLGRFLVVFLWGFGIQCALMGLYFSISKSCPEVCFRSRVL